MIIGHHSPASRPRLFTTERSRRDRGYVMVLFAMLLIPLLLLTGFAVDLGLWYNKTSDMRKAADAAALAGVVWLPDETKARSVAIETAAKNGFVANDHVSIVVTSSSQSARRLKVTIRDDRVGSFFYEALGGRTIDLKRTSYAEYILPVPLGSPSNVFGGPSMGLWGNIHGVRTDNTKGDAYAPACRGADLCGGTSNSNYRSSGYLYTVDVPAGVSNMDVKIYDAGLYDRGDESVDTGDKHYSGDKATTSTTTIWTFYNKDNTELSVSDNPTAAASGICSGGTLGTWTLGEEQAAGTYKNRWATLCRVAGSVPPGRYLLRVQTAGNGADANRYAIEIGASSTTKPRVAGYGDMSMYNNIAAGTARFYLAEVAPEHKGKTLELKLYDPGEVAGNPVMKIIAPSGSTAPSCTGITDSPSSTFTSGTTLSPCQFQTAVNGGARYNGYWITLRIPIPNGYSCIPGRTDAAGCWWKVEYAIGAQANDTTTWTAQILGDPVHLVEEY